jgi:flagellar motor protein MotB
MSITAISTPFKNDRSVGASDLIGSNSSNPEDFMQAFNLATSRLNASVNDCPLKKDANGNINIGQSLDSLVESFQNLTQSLQTQASSELQKEQSSAIKDRALRIQKELLLIGARIQIKGHPLPTKPENQMTENKSQKIDSLISL